MHNYEKFIILGDVHFGKYKSDPAFLENQIRFFKEQLIPYMKQNNISHIFQLGDLFDNRKTLDGYLYSELIKLFKYFEENDISISFPLGNHDIYFRESLEVFLPDILQKIFPNTITIIDKQIKEKRNDKIISFVPWLTEGVEIESNILDCDYMLGHFEIKDFEVIRGISAKHGIDSNVFGNTKVYSGHYHNIQIKNNITYVGTPFQFDWSDFKEMKGFWVTDFNDYEEFFENKISQKFIKIIYDDSNVLDDYLEVQGLLKENHKISLVDFLNEDHKDRWKKYKLKFIINHSDSGSHMKCIQYLKSIDGLQFDIINNHQVSKIINTDYASSFTHESKELSETNINGISKTEDTITKACQENNVIHILQEVIKIKNEEV